MSAPVTYYSICRIKANQTKAVKELGNKMAGIALADKNVLHYDWSVSEKGDKLFVKESFKDTKAFLNYLGNAKITAMVPQMMGLIDIDAIHVVTNVDAEARKALANFPNVSYFTPITGRQMTTPPL